MFAMAQLVRMSVFITTEQSEHNFTCENLQVGEKEI